MMNEKLVKIKKSIETIKNDQKIHPGPYLSKTGDKAPFSEVRENMSAESDTIQSLKKDYIRIKNKIKKMDKIIENLKSYLFIND